MTVSWPRLIAQLTNYKTMMLHSKQTFLFREQKLGGSTRKADRQSSYVNSRSDSLGYNYNLVSRQSTTESGVSTNTKLTYTSSTNSRVRSPPLNRMTSVPEERCRRV